jgi:membrane fusion protein, multidrug efflux system
MSSIARKTLILIIVGCLGIGGWWWINRDTSPTAVAPAAGLRGVLVEVATVEAKAMVRQVNAIGNIQSEESIIMRPEIAGRVESIGFNEGQPVQKGQLLIGLDTSIHQAELAQAQASLVLSQANHRRARDLVQRGATSQRTLDEALAKMKVDEASVALSQARLDKGQIRSPYDGLAGLRQVSIGDYVKEGEDLVAVDVVDPIKVAFRVPEVYLADVQLGQDIVFQVDALPGQSFAAQIYAIDSHIDINGRSLAVLARTLNEDHALKPGLFARVQLVMPASEGTLQVSEEAIVPDGNRHYVLRLVGGEVAVTYVTIGLRREGAVEILDGVKAGDQVVTAGHLKLRDGASVRVRRK